MKARLAILVLLLGSGVALAVKPDKPGCSDHALFPTRMPNYRLEACEVKEFAPYAFRVANGKKQTVEGKFTFLTYAVDDRKDDQSGVAVVRNYENALKKIGGAVKWSDPQRWVTGAVGAIEVNMKLAQARAEAVVTTLTTTHGIAATRLKGYGVGPLAPVASNDSDDGRAKNRRVELVEQ
jgi:hypothetical protein